MAETVKVRIFVAVDSDGNYGACGWPDATFGDVIDCADGLNGGLETQAWITAELPLPPKSSELPEVSGTIETIETANPEEQ